MSTPIDLEKFRSIGVISKRTRPQVREGRRDDGVRVKATTDELGNTVTEHAKGDRQDVHIRQPGVIRAVATERGVEQ
jgi:hypothetical protein